MSNQPKIRRYLLGDLPETDAERFEEEYFVSDDRFIEMLAAEDDLIEAFLHRSLSANDRQRFESRFLSTTRGRQKVALAAALENMSRVRHRRTWAKPLAIAAAVMVMLIGAGMLREIIVMRDQIGQLERAPRSAPAVPRPDKVFSIVLTGLERGSNSGATIVLPRDSATAELWLVLPRDDYPTYTVTLQSVDGHTLWSAPFVTSRALDGRKAIVVRIPSSSLEPGTFILAVTGDKRGAPAEPVEDFSFSVRRP